MDFFNTATSLSHSRSAIEDLFFQLYDCAPPSDNDIFYGLNLQWPDFELPKNYQKYFLSFHTECLNLIWVIQQAIKVYPRTIIFVTDYKTDLSDWPSAPENIINVDWITIHKQLNLLQKTFGIVNQVQIPRYKISSLSYRITQYKRFITAYLLENFDKNDMILTYHNVLNKPEDLHSHPADIKCLEKLNFDFGKTIINFDDKFFGNLPVNNGNWKNAAYTDALINLTNESFHYSKTTVQNKQCVWPGPYLTEKTFKPLLSGRPFLAIGQYNTYNWLQQLGLKIDFGFDITYDNDSGDLTRIEKIFEVLDFINQNSIEYLFESSLDSVEYNLQYISTGQLYDTCQKINHSKKHEFSIF